MDKSFVFSGNRIEVFKRIISLNLNVVSVLAVKNSYLHNYLVEINYRNFRVIDSKSQLIKILELLDFDIFIANGLPFILPISELKSGNSKRFINIHPSFLPDLKGADPIPGSLLFKRNAGATCHEMDDGIDTGSIISQFEIEFDYNFDCSLLYLLCFKAEVIVFESALKNNFLIQTIQVDEAGLIYYSFKEEDRFVNESDDVDMLLNKVRAFSNKSKGAIIKIENQTFLVYQANIIKSKSLSKLFPLMKPFSKLLSYDNKVLVNWNNYLVKFSEYKLLE